ncbi:MAG: DUF2442 domain-containing protein [Bdellovibrionales bacterium]|nr:DUF2442 domain-containing protein [Bdellovibrionales bacterium]
MKLIKIEKAEYLANYKILFVFSDKAKQEVDFSNFLNNSTHPEIRKYLDIDLFKKFQVVNGDIDWNNFDMCFPLSDLYEGTIDLERKESA